MVTTSVRGTITLYVRVSLKVKMRSIMSRSSSSMMFPALARSTKSRSCSCVTKGPSRYTLSGVSMLPSHTRTRASGPSMVRRPATGPASARATGSDRRRPMVRGDTPAMTKMATLPVTAAASKLFQLAPKTSTYPHTMNTTALASKSWRTNVITLMCVGSSRTIFNARSPPRAPSSAASWISWCDTTLKAESAAARTDASRTHTTATAK